METTCLRASQVRQKTSTGTSSITNCEPSSTVEAHASSYEDKSASFTTPERSPSFRCTAKISALPRLADSSSAISTMLIAMESSCMVLVCPRVDGCGQFCIAFTFVGHRIGFRKDGERSLAKADAAIVGGHGMICPDYQTTVLQERLEIGEEQLVLEHSA